MSRPFRFKQFVIHQERSPMKVGTDGVLLGAWAPHPSPLRILDIGCGTGLITLMLAQRYPKATIDSIEPHEGAYLDAMYNVSASPFASRIFVYNHDLGNHNPVGTYDLIVSNPPFFKAHLVSPDQGRSLARHVQQLSPERLLDAGRMCSENGILALIYPYSMVAELMELAGKRNLHVVHVCAVKPNPQKQPHRIMLAFGPIAVQPSNHTLTIETGKRHEYTPEMLNLIRSFYLNYRA